MMTKEIFRNFLKFRSDQRGSASIEALFAFPLLLMAATATYTFFDIYKAQNASYRANYTISDMLSREVTAIDTNYMDGMYKVFRYLTGADPDNSWIRISLVKCIKKCAKGDQRKLKMDWSYGANGARSLTDADFDFYNDYVPLLAQADSLILVETSMLYTAPFSNSLIDFSDRNLVNHVVTRPRGPQLIWDDTGYSPDGDDSHDDGGDNGNV